MKKAFYVVTEYEGKEPRIACCVVSSTAEIAYETFERYHPRNKEGLVWIFDPTLLGANYPIYTV